MKNCQLENLPFMNVTEYFNIACFCCLTPEKLPLKSHTFLQNWETNSWHKNEMFCQQLEEEEDWEYETESDDEVVDKEIARRMSQESQKGEEFEYYEEDEEEEDIPLEEQELPDPFSATPLQATTKKEVKKKSFVLHVKRPKTRPALSDEQLICPW